MTFYCVNIDITAFEASLPLCFLFIACFMLRHVIIPFPTGFLLSTEIFIIWSVAALDIKSKWGVCPLMTHPKAINPSYFLIFFEIVTGISNTPGTFIVLI